MMPLETWPPALEDPYAEEQPSPESLGYVEVQDDSEVDAVLAALSEALAPGDQFEIGAFEDDHFTVTYRGATYKIPTTFTRHDRWIAVSSAAEILNDRYSLFVHAGFNGESWRHLVVASQADVARFGPRPAHLMPLMQGVDYFMGDPADGHAFRIPYLNHPCPTFEADSAAAQAHCDAGGAAIDAMLDAMFTGKVDETKLKQVLDAADRDPKLKALLEAQSREAAVAEMKTALETALADPAVKGHAGAARDALNQVRAMTGQPPLGQPSLMVLPDKKPKRPWWKFW